jgi:hypothetical protein
VCKTRQLPVCHRREAPGTGGSNRRPNTPETAMKKIILPLALVAMLATGTAAFAATNNSVTGTIKALDAGAHTVTVDKTVYHFAKSVDLSKLKVGEKVTVTGHLYKKMEVGTAIVAAAMPAPAKPAPAKPMKTMTKTMMKTTTKKS